MEKTKQSNNLSPFIWIVLPLIVWFLPYVVKIIDRSLYKNWIYSEFGLVENLTVIVLIFAIVYGTKIFLSNFNFPAKWFKWYIALLTLGCFYFAGEELSWGQHFIGWGTPEILKVINDQSETNIHNIIPFFDQVPRTALVILTAVGGVLTPLFVTLRKINLNSKTNVLYWLFPTMLSFPTALLTWQIALPQKIYKYFNGDMIWFLNIKIGESKELFLAFFLMIYLLSIYIRLKKA